MPKDIQWLPTQHTMWWSAAPHIGMRHTSACAIVAAGHQAANNSDFMWQATQQTPPDESEANGRHRSSLTSSTKSTSDFES